MKPKSEYQEVNDIFRRATPKFFYSNVNGTYSDLYYFTRMTPEMFERVLKLAPKTKVLDISQVHQAEIFVLPLIKDMKGILLHGFRRGDWEISVEGMFIPVEYGELFLSRIAEVRRKREEMGENVDWVSEPDEWDEGYLFHYTDDEHQLIATDHVTDWEHYQDFWRTGVPWPESGRPSSDSFHVFYDYWAAHPKKLPTVTSDTPRYIRAWWD